MWARSAGCGVDSRVHGELITLHSRSRARRMQRAHLQPTRSMTVDRPAYLHTCLDACASTAELGWWVRRFSNRDARVGRWSGVETVAAPETSQHRRRHRRSCDGRRLLVCKCLPLTHVNPLARSLPFTEVLPLYTGYRTLPTLPLHRGRYRRRSAADLRCSWNYPGFLLIGVSINRHQRWSRQ